MSIIKLSIRLTVVLLLAALPAAAQDDPPAPDGSSCVVCHALMEEQGILEPPVIDGFLADVHAEAGLGCHDCHGGDPAPELAEDLAAMDPAAGYLGAPDRLEIADFCARCHSDLSYMRRFDPQARVDQLLEYRESVHGKRNAAGDRNVATCTDCHGVHGIRPVSRPDSPVFAVNVPKTCARCHADTALMERYGHSTGQFEAYQRSVHGRALQGGETAAPACNDCHGNHGAAPPGITSVSRVCGQCHGREGSLFRASIKDDLFEALEVPECSQCHGNHLVRHPTPALFHSGSAPRTSQGTIEGTDPLVAAVGTIEAGQGAEVSWVTVLPRLESLEESHWVHGIEVSSGEGAPLRIDATVLPGRPVASEPQVVEQDGLRVTVQIDPPVGLPVEPGDALGVRVTVEATAAPLPDVRVVDRPGDDLHTNPGSVCLECHAEGDECDVATERMYEALQALDSELREAEALLHRAELAGMEVGAATFELRSEGTTALVESRALVHSFDPERLIQRTDEGREIAARATAAGRAALDELQFRRKGLAVSLVLVVLVLIALYLKIREVDRSRRLDGARGAR